MASHDTVGYVNYPSQDGAVIMPSYSRLTLEEATQVQDIRIPGDTSIEMENRSLPPRPPVAKKEEPPPTIYLDIPDQNETQGQLTHRQDENSCLQETIFYDQFKNRRIHIPINGNEVSNVEADHVHNVDVDGQTDNNGQTENVQTGDEQTENRQIRPTRPTPPNTLYINYRGSTRTLTVTPVSRDSCLSTPTSEDGLIVTPNTLYNPMCIPSACRSSTTHGIFMTYHSAQIEVTNYVRTSSASNFSRVVTGNPAHWKRRCITCHHCGQDVHTIVIRQAGVMAHVLAALCTILWMGPFTFFVYCTDWFKNENHYCPQCNNHIGYEVPIIRQKFQYTKKITVA